MHTLFWLLVTSAAASALARSSGPTTTSLLMRAGPQPDVTLYPARRTLEEYLYPRYILPQYIGYDESPHILPPLPEHDWLNKEIDLINQMEQDEESSISYEDVEVPRWLPQNQYVPKKLALVQKPIQVELTNLKPSPDAKRSSEAFGGISLTAKGPQPLIKPKRDPSKISKSSNIEQKEKFALTPLEKGFYELATTTKAQSVPTKEFIKHAHVEDSYPKHVMMLEPPRQIRQNPNLSKTKTLVAENVERLRTGLLVSWRGQHEFLSYKANKDYRLPVSLLPSNLQWLRVNRPENNPESPQQEVSTDKSQQYPIHMVESDPTESIYGIALIAAVAAAFTLALFGFGFGWYTLSKKAKAAADVDYPAYGVTGPTVDTSGDRKLAHSAHMYHYQHQKQQIIAMERNGLDQRNGSVSDPESEEENEEGDYTVYECPGFATTGDMEVKNPIFPDEPTPATPGKCEVVKQQPKE